MEVYEETDYTIRMVKNVDLNFIDGISGLFVAVIASFFQIIYLVMRGALNGDPHQFKASVVRTPKNRFFGIEGYHFKENYLYTRSNLRMHYIDEGFSSNIVLCIHGVPFWSHSFRKIIPALVHHGYRVIVPDLIGFGKSDKLTNFRDHSIEMHLDSLKDLLRMKLNVSISNPIAIVGHNWGSLLSCLLLKEMENSISKLTILNTNNLPDGELHFNERFGGNFKNYFKYVIIDAYFLLFRSYSLLFGIPLPLTPLFLALNIKYNKEDLKGFTAPFLDKSERASITAFPQMVPVILSDRYSLHFKNARKYIAQKWKKPTQIIFSERSSIPIIQTGDFIVGNRRAFFTDIFPNAYVADPPIRGGHVIMYDNPTKVLAHLIPFLKHGKRK